MKTVIYCVSLTLVFYCYCTQPKRSELFFWPLTVNIKIPSVKSEGITALAFTGRYADYTSADTWYPSWAKDGNLYLPWTDGFIGRDSFWSFKWAPDGAHTGQTKIIGDDPLNLEIVSLSNTTGDPSPFSGRYP